MRSGQGLTEIKFRAAWSLGVAVSFILYFSGICTLYAYWRRSIRKRFNSVVLMYHHIHEDGIREPHSVSSANFERQLGYLRRRFRIVPLAETATVAGPGPAVASEDMVAITFDDGFKDNFENAFPLLKVSHLPATIFLVAGWIGRPGMLSENEIGQMQAQDIAFGAHTVNHEVLSNLDEAAARHEIAGSKEILEELLSRQVDFFAYPMGKKRDFSGQTTQIVKEAGYRAGFSTINGLANDGGDIFALNRLGVRDVPLFVFKVRVSGIYESRLFMSVRRILGLV